MAHHLLLWLAVLLIHHGIGLADEGQSSFPLPINISTSA
jgi:hypothetical protein